MTLLSLGIVHAEIMGGGQVAIAMPDLEQDLVSLGLPAQFDWRQLRC